MSDLVSLQELITTAGFGPDAVMAGAHQLSAVVREIELQSTDTLGLMADPADHAIVFQGPEGAAFELLLPKLKALRVAAAFVCTEPDNVLASTRWLADRIGLPVIACLGWPPLQLAQELRAIVHGSVVERGTVCAQIARELAGKTADPGLVVRTLAESARITCSVVGADDIVLAGPPLRRPGGVTVRVPVVAPGRVTVTTSLWLVSELNVVTQRRADLVGDALGIAAIALSAWAASSRLEAQRDATLKGNVLLQLLSSRGDAPAHTVEQATTLGWRLDGWHTAVCVRPDPAPDTARLETLTAKVSHALASAVPEMEVVRMGTAWLAWATQTSTVAPDLFDSHVAAVRRAVDQLGRHFVGGVGAPQLGLLGLVDSLIEAQQLAGAAGRAAGRNPVEDARVSPTRRLVMAAVSGREVVARSARLLAALEASNDHALLQTIETYLALESSKAGTAEALHLHRNTVTKRLDKIESVLQLSLDDPETRLALQLACRARTT